MLLDVYLSLQGETCMAISVEIDHPTENEQINIPYPASAIITTDDELVLAWFYTDVSSSVDIDDIELVDVGPPLVYTASFTLTSTQCPDYTDYALYVYAMNASTDINYDSRHFSVVGLRTARKQRKRARA